MAFGTPGGFASNPGRGVPTTSLGGRTTAGSHRVFQRGAGGTRSVAGRGRPIEDFPKMFGHLRQASEGLPVQLVYPLANAMRDQLMLEGAKYRLRGSSGKKVRLTAHTEAARNSRGTSQISRFVVATPPGFWAIVERGSQRHLIAGRYKRGGGGRLTIAGATAAFGYRHKTGAPTAGADTMGGGSPINTFGLSKGAKDGWAQYAVHPGHRPLGRPWRRAMSRGQTIMDKMTEDYAHTEMVRAFFR